VSKFSWQDIFKLRYVTDAQLSPDGKYLLYVKSLPDGLNDNRKTCIWIMNLQTGEQHPWRKGLANSPRWLPGSSRIAYRAFGSNGEWKYFVGTIDEPGNTALTLPGDAAEVSWSPDGKYIAFTHLVAEPAVSLGLKLTKPDSVKWAEPARIFTQKHFFSDGAGETKAGFTHIFIMPANGGTPKQLTTGSYNHISGFDWTPDSKYIVFSSAMGKDWETNYYNQDLYRIKVDDGTLSKLTSFPYGVNQPFVSPDGKFIAFIGVAHNKKDYEAGELYIINADGSNLRSLSNSLDREISSLRWEPNGKSIFASYNDHGISKLTRFGLDGSIKVLTELLEDNDTYTFSQNGVMVVSLIKDNKPANLFVLKSNGQLRQLTHENDSLFNSIRTGTARKMVVKSSIDSVQIDSWITLPSDYDASKRYPMILSIHGGPHGDDGPRWSSESELFAAAGYVVLKVNYRGSTSYGFAFADKIYRNFPGPAYNDLMDAVDAATTKGIADPDELFVTGGSAGGQLTAWIVGKTNRFKAAAAVKPVINEVGKSLSNDQYPSAGYEFSKQVWEDPLAYWRNSPLSLVDKVVTPTLLLVGEDDRRTPVNESIQFYQALQLRNIPTAIAIVPHASHETLNVRPSQLINDDYIILDWFGRHGGIPLNQIIRD